ARQLFRQRFYRSDHTSNTESSTLALHDALPILQLKVKTGEDGKMFGGITAGLIADELKNQFEAVVDKKKIHIEHPIRTLGDHEVELRLHPDVNVTLKVHVESTTPLPPKPEEAGTAAPAAPAKGERAPRSGTRAEKASPATEKAEKARK